MFSVAIRQLIMCNYTPDCHVFTTQESINRSLVPCAAIHTGRIQFKVLFKVHCYLVFLDSNSFFLEQNLKI